MQKNRIIKILIFTIINFSNGAFAQIINTWEMFKSHEIYYRVEKDSVTLAIDTIIIEQPENAFYKYTKDSIYVYDLDYEDSKLRNCYMFWPDRYKLFNDTAFSINTTPGFITSSTFHFYGDTMVQTELWWEDSPDFMYHQTKIFYFVKRGEIALPPAWWPKQECHSTNTIRMIENHRPEFRLYIENEKYNLMGQKIKFNYTGLKVNKYKKFIELNKK